MSVFHRVDDAAHSLPAPLFFSRANRLAAYRGVVRERVTKLYMDEQEELKSAGSRAKAPQVMQSLEAEGWIEARKE